MNQFCTACGHYRDHHRGNDNNCTVQIYLGERSAVPVECPCTKYLPPSERIPEASETPVKLSGKQVYVAARNYIANELQITSGQILEMMAKRADAVVLAFLKNHKDSMWLKRYIQQGVDRVIREEVREVIRLYTRVSVEVTWPPR